MWRVGTITLPLAKINPSKALEMTTIISRKKEERSYARVGISERQPYFFDTQGHLNI